MRNEEAGGQCMPAGQIDGGDTAAAETATGRPVLFRQPVVLLVAALAAYLAALVSTAALSSAVGGPRKKGPIRKVGIAVWQACRLVWVLDR